jgi:predicted DNA-binding transcriptional regulator YafY
VHSKNLKIDGIFWRKTLKVEILLLKHLDRITDVEIHNTSAECKKFDVEKAFQNSFGIISTADEKPIEIVLSFNSFQGKYIKSLPLHYSQEILEDNDNELVVKLKLVPTFDFKQEILSLGNTVKVCSPKSFRDEISLEIKEMHSNYSG